jgi:UPF0716 protein FxsA
VGALIAVVAVIVLLGLPILEIWILIQIGSAIGIGWTLLLLIADAVLGAWIVRHEGRRAWAALQSALRDAPASGRAPTKEVLDGALVLVGGTLLLAPGFVSDVFGLLCVLPFTRPLVRILLVRRFSPRPRVVPTHPKVIDQEP